MDPGTGGGGLSRVSGAGAGGVCGCRAHVEEHRLRTQATLRGRERDGLAISDWSVNTFYAVFRGQYPRQSTHWVVRRVEGAPNRDARVLWADSRTCPAVEQALIAMERIPAARPDAPGLGREAADFGMVMDGAHHTFWNRSARSGENEATVTLAIEGNVNAPIAGWWSTSASRLSGCWGETPPQYVRLQTSGDSRLRPVADPRGCTDHACHDGAPHVDEP